MYLVWILTPPSHPPPSGILFQRKTQFMSVDAIFMQFPYEFSVVDFVESFLRSEVELCLFVYPHLHSSQIPLLVSHDLFSLKRCWRSCMRPCPSRCLTKLEANICLRTLQRMQVRMIDL